MVRITSENYREHVLRYYDEVAPEYGVKHGADMPGGRYSFGELYRAELAHLFAPGMDVLELGCGNGASSAMLATYEVNLTATDISDEMLKVASAREIPNTSFRRLDAMALAEVENLGPFDVIVAFNSFAYYPDKPRVLRDLKALLKPGGKLVVLDMNAHCPIYPLSAWIGRLDMNSWWTTTREMRPASLRPMFEEAGYRVNRIRTLNFVPHAVKGPVFRVLKALNPVLNALPLVNKLAMRVVVEAELASA